VCNLCSNSMWRFYILYSDDDLAAIFSSFQKAGDEYRIRLPEENMVHVVTPDSKGDYDVAYLMIEVLDRHIRLLDVDRYKVQTQVSNMEQHILHLKQMVDLYRNLYLSTKIVEDTPK
jgi:hypothetical protein